MTTDGLEQLLEQLDPQLDRLDHFSINDARDGLGTIVARAGFGDQRIAVTRYGIPRAIIIGLRDFARLIKLDELDDEELAEAFQRGDL